MVGGECDELLSLRCLMSSLAAGAGLIKADEESGRWSVVSRHVARAC